jgi:hypothetical protein
MAAAIQNRTAFNAMGEMSLAANTPSENAPATSSGNNSIAR